MVGGWCGCLSGARCRQLYDLHINAVTYTLFFIPDYQFQKVFLCFCGGPLLVATAQFAPALLKPGPDSKMVSD